ncbi:STAS domain-containing protein [Sinomonas sp. P10A9]|uniref:STAS domain-containing protein n=1 Tax=Sinomonas puerhi TaxID=3238584 RepID=A0AB39L4K9_9MICC
MIRREDSAPAPGAEARQTTVRLQGRLDAGTGNEVLHRLLAALGPGSMLLVDLSGVEAVEAAGAEILAAVRRQALLLGGDLRVTGAAAHPLFALVDAGPEDSAHDRG